MSVFVLYLNIFLYLFVFIRHSYKKQNAVIAFKPKSSVGVFVLGLYLLVSFFGLLLYLDPNSSFKHVYLIPSLYLYLTLLFMSFPLLRFNDDRMRSFKKPSVLLMDSIVSIAMIVALLSSFHTLKSMNDLTGIIYDWSTANDAYNDARAEIKGGGVVVLYRTFNYLFSYLYILFFFYYMTQSPKRLFDKLVVVVLGFSLVVSFISQLLHGVRGPMVFMLFNLFFCYVLFRKVLSQKIKKVVRKTILAFSLVAIGGFSIVTLGRFGEGSYNEKQGMGIGYGIKYYLGQPFLYFNNYGLDPGGTREGDKCFPLVKKIVGLQYSSDWEERRSRYHVRINDEVFYTYVGDFTIDFGVEMGTIILFFIGLFFYITILKNKKQIDMSTIILLYINFIICTNGFTLYPFAELGGNRTLVFMLFLAMIFNVDARSKKVKQFTS